MHARSEHFGQEAWLEAWTEMDGRGFRYDIVSESGSDYIRTKVLKAVLKREQELVEDGDCGRSELTPENYDFEDAAQENGEQYVTIRPKRKDVLLVDGRMVLSADGSELFFNTLDDRLSTTPRSGRAWSIYCHHARVDGVRADRHRITGVNAVSYPTYFEYETITASVSLLGQTRPPTTTR
jgi:hypothetical protein